jgi:two-component system chemotaxis response regulator CheB
MHEPIFALETASAHLRELLLSSCTRHAPTAVFASVRAARSALLSSSPAVLVVGGAPLDDTAIEVARNAIQRGIPTLACVNEHELRSLLQVGVLDVFERTPQGIEALAGRVSGLLADKQRSLAPRAAATLRPRVSAPVTYSNGPLRLGSCRLIAVGASTGGPDAIAYLLSHLPTTLPGILIVQHMPGTQTGAFAQRLDEDTQWQVREASDGARIERGVALIAPGGQHLRVQFGGMTVSVSQEGPSLAHMPSVDVLFESVARELQRHALGVLLTGMGDDGAHGLLAMREAGAHTLVQSAATCAVYGMPRRAAELGAANEIVSLLDMPERIASHCFGSADGLAALGRPRAQ